MVWQAKKKKKYDKKSPHTQPQNKTKTRFFFSFLLLDISRFDLFPNSPFRLSSPTNQKNQI
jgi:hypothetical protein